YVSDGTDVIRILDPTSFREVRRISVVDEYGPLAGLNELEYGKGKLFANVWGSDTVVVIDPQTGRVVARLDFRGLLPREVRTGGEDVLNGIAYDELGDRFFITGKCWPLLFVIRLKGDMEKALGWKRKGGGR
ncbi:MAG: glutaminyl-peptide cyclotransferase, partial [Syntrophales bacterium]|nr:glutaminyl-peptide cyclotransferase [Syntrophales bacterium]